MKRWLILAGAVSLICPAWSEGAGVRVTVRLPRDLGQQALTDFEASKRAIVSLLAPGSREVSGTVEASHLVYTRVSDEGYNLALPEAQRRRMLSNLLEVWKGALTVEDLPEVGTAPAQAPRKMPRLSRINTRATGRRVTEALNVGVSRERQNLYYDQARAHGGIPAVAAAESKAVSKAQADLAEKGLKINALPSPKSPQVKQEVRWGRVGLEALKGVGEVVREVFTLKGLAIAAGAVALVTVAPVTVYGLLALGVAMGGYTVGKAIYDGVTARRKGDVGGVYAASREFGKGALTLGLSLYGARHVPKNLTPHIPRAGEYKALLSSMDDEAIVVTSLFERFRSKPAAAH